MRRQTRSIGPALALALAACAPATRLSAQRESLAGDSVPVGFGSLHRDDIVLRFATDQLQVQLLPLDERVIRLLAPDTYRSLEQLLDSRREDLVEASRRAGSASPTLVLVTFYGLAPGARFTPEEVQLQSRGRLFRPLEIVPLSPTWSTLQLDQRQQAVAIYLYEEPVSWNEDLSANYQQSSASWSHSLRLLQQERARVQARAQSRPVQPPPNP